MDFSENNDNKEDEEAVMEKNKNGVGDDGAASSSQPSTEPSSSSSSDDSSLVSEDYVGEIPDVEVSESALAQRYGNIQSNSDEDDLIVEGKRRRIAVDYKALNKEMFGDDGTLVLSDGDDHVGAEKEDEDEEDEVWSPRVLALKAKMERQRRRKEEDDDSSLSSSSSSEEDSSSSSSN